MRAVLYVDKETGTTVGEVPDPTPGPADVIVAVEACGLCGSDVHAVQNGGCAPGQVLGHEFSGRIAALGAEVSGWRAGQAVAASPIGSCGECRICARGLPFRCPAVENIGITIPGAYAQYVKVPARQLVALPADLPVEIGSHAEPLSVGSQAVKLAQVGPGDPVLVYGVGPIGLYAIMALKLAGVGPIVAAGRSAGRRQAAARRPADRPAATMGPAPASLSAMIAYSPIGPTPYTSTGSPGPTWASLTAWRPTESGSACDPTSTGTSSGSATSCRAGTLTYCAYAPGMVIPMFSTAGQRNGSPRAQIRHTPHDPIGEAATACPIFHPDTSGPRATIRPLNSCPSTCPGAQFPFCTECTSDPHSPQASTATITSAGPGVGSGTSPTVVPVSLSTYRTARTGCPASR